MSMHCFGVRWVPCFSVIPEHSVVDSLSIMVMIISLGHVPPRLLNVLSRVM